MLFTHSAAGSSPLARGLRSTSHSPNVHYLDHPRSRGVYIFLGPGPARHQGSSPLARGLPVLRLGGPGRARIIPARAGFTHRVYLHRARPPDHPRSRGVYRAETPPTTEGKGSSPLARGLRLLEEVDVGRDRIIPARAGFTGRRFTNAVHLSDHPRSRGVYWRAAMGGRSSIGSSPLARGLPALGGGAPPRGRIIPARAGFTGRR